MPEEIEGLYARQELLDLVIPHSATVVGCGGVGSWVAILAGMSGIAQLCLYDPDILEESNRNRLPFCQSSLGRPKVDVVADFIKGIREDILVVPIQTKFTPQLLAAQLTASGNFWVVDATDSPKSQIALYNACSRSGVSYIRAGYDGTHITITSNVSGWIKKDVEEETYEIQPSWVVPSAICAALAVAKMMKFFEQEVCLDISEIGIPALQRQKKVSARCYQSKADQGSTPEETAAPRTRRRRTA